MSKHARGTLVRVWKSTRGCVTVAAVIRTLGGAPARCTATHGVVLVKNESRLGTARGAVSSSAASTSSGWKLTGSRSCGIRITSEATSLSPPPPPPCCFFALRPVGRGTLPWASMLTEPPARLLLPWGGLRRTARSVRPCASRFAPTARRRASEPRRELVALRRLLAVSSLL
jgi:hypothetical protein